MAKFPYLTNSELEQIANILGDTSSGFTGSKISKLLTICSIPDAWTNGTKRIRLLDSFANCCNQNKSSNCVYAFIQEPLALSRWLDYPVGRETIMAAYILGLFVLQLADGQEKILDGSIMMKNLIIK